MWIRPPQARWSTAPICSSMPTPAVSHSAACTRSGSGLHRRACVLVADAIRTAPQLSTSHPPCPDRKARILRRSLQRTRTPAAAFCHRPRCRRSSTRAVAAGCSELGTGQPRRHTLDSVTALDFGQRVTPRRDPAPHTTRRPPRAQTPSQPLHRRTVRFRRYPTKTNLHCRPSTYRCPYVYSKGNECRIHRRPHHRVSIR